MHVAAFESCSLRHFQIGAEQTGGTLASPKAREDEQPETRRLHFAAPHRRPRFVPRYGGKRFGAHRLAVARGLQGCPEGVWYRRVHLLIQLWQPLPAGGVPGQASDGTHAPGPKRLL